MKIGLITLSRINANQSKYYNAQDFGLAKALARKGHEILIYRLTRDVFKREREEDITITYHKVKGLGKQSICKFEFLDSTMDRLICFSDNQISFPYLHNWCMKNSVLLQPYVGVLQSNSPKKTVQIITNTLVKRNVKRYRNMKSYGKTPDILSQFTMQKVNLTELVPVCLNVELLKSDCDNYNKTELRQKYGYDKEDLLLLFIGRLEKEKEPIEMLELLKRMRKTEKSLKLLMVGKGSLEEEVSNYIKENELKEYVRSIPQISNKEIWELYYISDCFVNLNRHEIYGMSILESLYYRCPVVAMNAPGPAYILQQGEVGMLCEEIEDLERCILSLKEYNSPRDTKEYLLERLSWDKVCDKFLR